MGFDPHERARFLIGESRIAEIGLEDALWVRGHVTDCAGCALYEEEVKGIVRGLKSFAFEPDPAMSERIKAAIATPVRRSFRLQWRALAAAAILAVAAIQVYQSLNDTRREKADALLMERVESHVWRVVPVAMEPLVQGQPEESK